MSESDSAREYHRVRMEHLYGNAAFRFRSAADFAQLALRSILTANGGAVIAMLTFLGNTNLVPKANLALWAAFACFLLGLVGALAATLLAYLTQGDYARQDTAGADKIYAHNIGDPKLVSESEVDEDAGRVQGEKFENAAIACFIIALVAFVLGALFGVYSLTTIPTPS